MFVIMDCAREHLVRLDRRIKQSANYYKAWENGGRVTAIASSEPVRGFDGWEERGNPFGLLWGYAITSNRNIAANGDSSFRAIEQPLTADESGLPIFHDGDCIGINLYPSEHRVSIIRPFGNSREIYCMKISGGGFICSSDTAAIVELVPADLELDVDTLVSVFRFGAPSTKRTLFDNIRRPHTGSITNWSPDRGMETHSHTPFDAGKISEIRKSIDGIESANRVWENILERKTGELMKFYSAADQPQAVTLSGGIDSSLVLALAHKSGVAGQIATTSIANSKAARRTETELTEREAIEFISKKFGTSHSFFEVTEVAQESLVKQYVETCFDAIGTSIEYFCYLTSVRNTGTGILMTGFCADGLMTDMPNYERVTREIQHLQPEYFLYQLRQFILRYRPFRGAVRRLFPNFIKDSRLYTYYPIIETIAGNEMLSSWFDDTRLKRINDEYLIADDYVLNAFEKVDGLLLFLLSDFTKIGIATKQRFDKAARMLGMSWWSPFCTHDAMETALAIPIDYRNMKHDKHLSRTLVDKYIGPEIAYRAKYGFSLSIGSIMTDRLNMWDEVLDGKVLDCLPWRSSRIVKTIRNWIENRDRCIKKYVWHLYWLEKTLEKWRELKKNHAE